MCLYGGKIEGMLRKTIISSDTAHEFADILELDTDAICRCLPTVLKGNSLRDQSLDFQGDRKGVGGAYMK